jgi:hypothetical protein
LPACVLCARCNAVQAIRYLYRIRVKDLADPGARQRQRRESELRERARLRLPLFGDPEVG